MDTTDVDVEIDVDVDVDVLGIDIAKDSCVVTLLRVERAFHRTFKNTSEGFGQLAKWLGKHKVTHVHACMEATGTYGNALAEWLHATGHRVSVVNPMAIHAYAKSQLARNKTDALDADLIARYCVKEHPQAWEPDPPEVRELQALLRRVEAVWRPCRSPTPRKSIASSPASRRPPCRPACMTRLPFWSSRFRCLNR